MSDLTIRRPIPSDASAWRTLWQGYNDFYKRTVEPRTTDRVWDHLMAGNGQPHGFVADLNGAAVGFTHYFFVPSTSDWTPRCYMQDLFADPSVRGKGIGRALIEAVYGAADAEGASQTFWLTQTTNTTARLLYDRLARETDFIKYAR